jgi:hypothetical protein
MLIGDRITKEQIIAFRAPSNAASIQKDELLKDVRLGEESGFRLPARLTSEGAKNLYIFEYRGETLYAQHDLMGKLEKPSNSRIQI